MRTGRPEKKVDETTLLAVLRETPATAMEIARKYNAQRETADEKMSHTTMRKNLNALARAGTVLNGYRIRKTDSGRIRFFWKSRGGE